MGQAFDRDGQVLGDALGDTKQHVFEQLDRAFPEAAEIRIRAAAARATVIGTPLIVGTPLDATMSNDLAYQLGEIARVVGGLRSPEVGDSIDRGLILRRELAEAGFDLVRRG